MSETITRGTVFDTDFEFGCVATSAPDNDGNFTARDSDCVECEFHVSMVIATR